MTIGHIQKFLSECPLFFSQPGKVTGEGIKKELYKIDVPRSIVEKLAEIVTHDLKLDVTTEDMYDWVANFNPDAAKFGRNAASTKLKGDSVRDDPRD